MKKPFKKQEPSIKKQMRQRKKLLSSFVTLYRNPVIVHAIHDKKVFHQILKESILKLPNDHTSPQKTPYMEKFLGINNCIYYSLGFVYFSSYKWKYNLLFDIKYLKDLEYYNNSINFQAARAVVDYWYENDSFYLKKFANANGITRQVMDRYLNEFYNGKKRTILEFWKIEKELFEHINAYHHKKKLLVLIKGIRKKHLLRYPFSKQDALACYMKEKAPEMIGKRENNLLKNPHFIGFFIDGPIDRTVLNLLKNKYAEKIIFNGKSIRVIGDL